MRPTSSGPVTVAGSQEDLLGEYTVAQTYMVMKYGTKCDRFITTSHEVFRY
jgi:hypothetical protein